MIAILIIVAVIGWAAAIVLGIAAVRYGLLVLAVEDRIETSLDVLNDQYATLSRVLATPLASDDPYTRSVVQAIKRARDAVLDVANQLVGQKTGTATNGIRKDTGENGE